MRPDADLRLQHLDPADHRRSPKPRTSPEHFIGIHFFSPVEKMMLVEVIMGEKTGDAGAGRRRSTSCARSRRRRSWSTTRAASTPTAASATISREGHMMLAEGVPPAMIENVGQDGRHAGRAAVAQRRGGDRPRLRRSCRRPSRTSATAAVDPGAGAAARRDGRTSMAASAARTARASTTIRRRARRRSGPDSRTSQAKTLDPDAIDVAELKQRFLVVQALEAARTVEEGIVTDPREADVGSILGFGFAPFTGGTLSYIDGMGAEHFVALCDALAANHGARFRPPRCCATWRRRARASTGASPRGQRPRPKAFADIASAAKPYGLRSAWMVRSFCSSP